MRTRSCFVAFFLLATTMSVARADVFVEDWNDPSKTNNDWQYWVAGTNVGTRPGVEGQNQNMNWFADRGVDRSGCVSSPSDEWLVTWDRLWPAYMAPPDDVAPVNLAKQLVSIRVNDFGTLASAPGPDELSLHFFIGEWLVNGPGLEDDEYAFFQHNATIAVGSNIWEATDFAIGGDSNWSVIIKSLGNMKTPSDLYLNPQQWGFVLDHDSLPDGIELGFDQLESVPEPSGLALFSMAMMGAVLYGWRCRTAMRRPRRQ